MIYLFAAFAVVWVGLFLYLALLARRTEAVARELAMLRAQPDKTRRPASPPEARTGAARPEPS